MATHDCKGTHSLLTRAMSRCILVTGGSGYIGSHTTLALVEAGFKVVIVDNLCNSSVLVLDRIRELAGDKADAFSFYEARRPLLPPVR